MREFVRVLRREGTLALSTWDLPERARFLGILVDALAECGVTRPRESPAGPDPYRFADADEFRALLRGAGGERNRPNGVHLRPALTVAACDRSGVALASQPWPADDAGMRAIECA